MHSNSRLNKLRGCFVYSIRSRAQGPTDKCQDSNHWRPKMNIRKILPAAFIAAVALLPTTVEARGPGRRESGRQGHHGTYQEQHGRHEEGRQQGRYEARRPGARHGLRQCPAPAPRIHRPCPRPVPPPRACYRRPVRPVCPARPVRPLPRYRCHIPVYSPRWYPGVNLGW